MTLPDTLPATLPAAAQDVLNFWFSQPPARWFTKDAAFDQEVAQRFGATLEQALAGALAPWAATPRGALALIIVLDQFTRNTLRGSARAFAGDAQALALARKLVADSHDKAMASAERQFSYLPFEHSESLADQQEAVRLFKQLAQDDAQAAGLVDWAQRHLDIVARFGRFPHRNAALQRASTPEELEFLKQPGSGF